MKREDDELGRETDISRRKRSSQEPAAAGQCSACGGTGKVLLLLSSKPCQACGGTGKALRAGKECPAKAPATEPVYADIVVSEVVERVPGQMVTTTTYDNQGRLRMLSQMFEPDRPVADPGGIIMFTSGGICLEAKDLTSPVLDIARHTSITLTGTRKKPSSSPSKRIARLRRDCRGQSTDGTK